MTEAPAVFCTDRAQLSDIKCLVELRQLLLSSGDRHYSARSPDDDLQWHSAYADWLGSHIEATTGRICIAVTHVRERSIVGCAIGIVDDRAPMCGCLNGRVGWVQTVVVDPRYRRRGIARKNMEFLFRWFGVQRVRKVALQTTAEARELYTTLGFANSGEDLLIKLHSTTEGAQ